MKKTVFCLGEKNEYINYYNALVKCDAKPIFNINTTNAYECDCLLLLGGDDVNPKLYGETNTHCIGIDDKRDEIEIQLIKLFSELNKPILGICRGIQILNVAFGGSLIQHIDESERHSRRLDKKDKIHKIITTSSNFLSSLYSHEFYVNSAHHQAVKKISDEFNILAYSDDRVIEAIMHNNKKIIGLQWHPERMFAEFYKKNRVDPSLIFKYFLSL